MRCIYHLRHWAKKFPVTFGCAIVSLIFIIEPALVPVELLKTYYFNENVGLNIWLTVLIPFTYEFVKILHKQIKHKKKYLTSEGKISYKLIMDEMHVPAFHMVDLVAILAIIFGLLIEVWPAVATSAYPSIHFFEKFVSIIVVPFLSGIIYMTKVEREEAVPNSIINPSK